ncbi:MAG: PhnD/SsuA/transferrin family substrate-binding protein [Polyangiaceae bacterium]|nr:PhnD/SsuA/transferrin family substrate-binding protein [Polyangiaceae bacterium]
MRSQPPSIPRAAVLAAALAAASLSPAPAGAEGEAVGVLVVKEHGVGSAAQAQPYVDRFVALTAKQNGWAGAKGDYQTTRAGAEKVIADRKPRYGIFSLAAFLGLQAKHKLEPIGQVTAARAGGQQYHVISKTAADLAGCKGKRLASDHADDARFLENVVGAGKLKLADFTLVATTRPIQTIKKVIVGEADCALIDDAQLAELGHLEGAADVKAVWASEKLPPMVVAAFPSAPAAEKKALQQSLPKLCEGEGKGVCAEVGLQSIKSASATDFQALIAAYGK